MMNRILRILFVISIICGSSYLIILLVRVWLSWLLSLDRMVSGAVITALLGLIGLIYSQQQIKRRELAEQHRPKKMETYEALFVFLKYTNENEELFKGKTYQELQQLEHPEEIKNVLWELNKGLLVWSSPKVVRAWLEYRQSLPKRKNPLAQLDKLLRAVRKDLGNSNFGLKSGDAMKGFLRQPEEYDRLAALYATKKK